MEPGFVHFSFCATVVNVIESEASVDVYFFYDASRLKRNLKCVKREVAKGSWEYKMLGHLRIGDKIMACPEENNTINGVGHKSFIKRMINLLKTRF